MSNPPPARNLTKCMCNWENCADLSNAYERAGLFHMAKIVSIVHGTRNGALRASTEKHLQLDQMSDRNDRRYFVAAHHWHP